MSDLAQAIEAYTQAHAGGHFWMTAIDGLLLLRADQPRPPSHLMSQPALCVVAQGAKWTSFGTERHSYSAGEALVVTVEMPSVGRVYEASPGAPFLGAVIQFSPVVMREIGEQLKLPAGSSREPGGATVMDMDPELTDCVLRMVRLLGQPSAIPILAPLLMREFSYRLLVGPQGGRVADLALGHDRRRGIMQALATLRQQFAQPLRIAELAEIAGVSPSAFHRQFKAMTSLTPIQYQKQLRLLEARRLILGASGKVELAAYATGYESASQFSREYTRMFGCSPRQDLKAGPALPQVA
ncbi:AraC family transcriptional regulator [Frateuria aurantia]